MTKISTFFKFQLLNGMRRMEGLRHIKFTNPNWGKEAINLR